MKQFKVYAPNDCLEIPVVLNGKDRFAVVLIPPDVTAREVERIAQTLATLPKTEEAPR